MARPTKYNATIAGEICQLLAVGAIVEDICKKVNLDINTFYAWQKRFPDFADAVSRARSEANIGATVVLRRAMAPHDDTRTVTKNFTETRIDAKTREPYEYHRVEVIEEVTHLQGDWRAALEFLRRRDPEHWTERLIVVLQPEHDALFKKYGTTAQQIVENAYRQILELEQRAALLPPGESPAEKNEDTIVEAQIVTHADSNAD